MTGQQRRRKEAQIKHFIAAKFFYNVCEASWSNLFIDYVERYIKNAHIIIIIIT